MYVKKSGLGYDYYTSHKEQMYADDGLYFNGKKGPIPRYFDKKYESERPKDLWETKRKRPEVVQILIQEDMVRFNKRLRKKQETSDKWGLDLRYFTAENTAKTREDHIITAFIMVWRYQTSRKKG